MEPATAPGGHGMRTPPRSADVPDLTAWTFGNRVQLLENGEEYYPAVFSAIRHARREVLLETFLWFQDKVGHELRDALLAAARNGAEVAVTVDGYGTPDLTADFIGEMTAAGIDFRIFDPRPAILGIRTNAFRRLHRKIVVVDRRVAFIGGINYSDDHLRDFGPEAKRDYSVQVEGPIVEHIHALARAMVETRRMPRARPWWRSRVTVPPPLSDQEDAGVAALLVWRDNEYHRDDIELHYRMAMRAARREIIIANAYFLPSYRLLRELQEAARRGIDVRLIMQGTPDKPVVKWAAETLYDALLRAGVHIYEYCEQPFHGKIAIIDDAWCTVGSSNLDPLSLSLNLEANLIFHDRRITAELRSRLCRLIEEHCRRIDPASARPRSPWKRFLSVLVFHALRRAPSWAGWLPTRQQNVIAASEASSRRAA